MNDTTSIFDLTTDKLDYAPGEFALFTVTGIQIGGAVEFQVLHVTDPGNDGVFGTLDDVLDAGPDEILGTEDDGYGTTGAGHDPFYVIDGGAGDLDGADGVIQTNWYVNPDDSLNETFLLSAAEVQAGADDIFGTADDLHIGETATTSFTDAGGAYTLNFAAADPSLYIPPIPFPADLTAPTGSGNGNSLIPLAQFNDGSSDVRVESLAPQDMALGQIVPFELKISVSGDTTPENGVITFVMGWNTLTTNSGDFGYDARGDDVGYGVIGAFIDTGDGSYIDAGNDATVDSFTWSLINDEIVGVFTVSGLDDGDMVVLEPWLVLDDTIPAGIGGNVQSRLIDAATGSDQTINVANSGAITLVNGDSISTGNQTVPLLKPSDFFTADVDLEVLKSDNQNDPVVITAGDDPVNNPDDFTVTQGDTLTYTIVVSNAGPAVANTVVVYDELDPNVTFVSASDGGFINTDGGDAIPDGAVQWNVGALAPGDSVEYTVTVTVNGDAPAGSVTGEDLLNTVTVTTISNDTNLLNNTNTEPTGVDAAIGPTDLTITKAVTSIVNPDTSDGGSVVDQAGDVINYQITLDNEATTGSLTGVTVSDPLLGTLTGPSGDADSDTQLDPDEIWTYTGSYTVTQDDLDSNGTLEPDNVGPGFIDNIATASSNETFPDVTASAEVPVEQNAAIAIDKSATVPGGTADVAGEVISYSIDVTNAGNVSLSGVTVDDPRISDLAFVGGDADSDSELDTTETWSYTGSYAVTQADLDAGGTIDNTATADSNESDSATDSAEVPVEQNAAIAIDKSATVPGGTADVAGEVISYSIDVTNAGNVSLSGVTVDDPRISDLAFVGGDADSDSELDTTETWSYTGSYAVTQADLDAGGTIDNTATADSNESDSATDSAEVPVEQNAAIAIDKSATVPGGTADVAGEVISYSIDVTNAGNVSLSGVTVDDPRISDLAFVGGDADSDSELDTTETWSYTGSYAVTQADLDAGGTIDNTATADSNESDSATDSAEVPVEQNAAIAIDKSATVPGGTADVAGEVISYSIDVTNAGNVSLSGVTVDDPRISDLAFVGGDADSDSELDTTETWSYTGSYAVTQADLDAGGTIDNTATADSNESDSATDSAEVPVEQNAAIAIDKSATVPGGTADVAGEVISYSIDVTNAGNVSLSGVTVDDPRISDLAFVGGDADSDSELDTTETWSYTGSYAVTQADLDAGGTIDNTATADSNESDSATDSAEVPVEQNAAIAIDKSATVPGGTADVAGEVISYSIDVTNAGNVSLSGVTVDDPRISDLAFVGGDADSDSELDTTETWSYTGSYAVTQADLDAGGTIDNTATADSNESDSATDSAEVPVEQNAAIAIDKSATVPGGTADVAGEVISYSIDVTNAGNVSLSGVTVDDPRISDLAFSGGDADSDGQLDTGETWTYTGSYTVDQADLDAGTNIDNTATADSDETGPETDSATIPVAQTADITIDKSAALADSGTAADEVGDTINYTITVGNDGNVSLTGVTVADTFITDLAFAGGDADSDGELDTNETWTYTGSYEVTQDDLDDGGNIANVATADSNETDTETASTDVPVDQQPDITISKAAALADSGTAADEVGDTINYTITVGNDGNVSLTGVTVADTFITDLAFAGGDADSDGELDTNETWTYTGSYEVTQDDLDDGGNIANVATADSNETDTETASTDVPVDQQPDITISKAAALADSGTAADEVGDTINYTITVGNDGNVSLTGVTVADTFITDLAFAGGDADSDGELDTNETWTYTGSYEVTQDDLDDGGNIANVATADSNETDTETASTDVPVDQQPDITISKAAALADSGTAADEVGDTINYTITVGNDGNVSLTGVTVADTFITDLAFAGGDADSDGELDTNETWTYTGSYEVTQDDLDDGGNIANVATADSNETDTETASTDVPVDQQPDITISKAAALADSGTAADEVGDTINYIITVGNDGNVSLTGVTVADTFITDLAFAGGDADSDGELDTNETWTYTGSYEVTQDDLDDGGNIANVATADSNETDTETASTDVPVDQQPDITISKAAALADSGTAADEVGDTINYTITVGNDGNVSLTGVTVADTFITDLAFAGGDADSDGELDTNETWTYTGSYEVTQDDLDDGGNIANVATADSNETDTETASTDVPVDQQPDITIAKASSIADGGTAVDEVGDTINYTITVGNDGNVSLTNVSVSDTFITDLAFAGGDADSDSELDTNETWTYTGSYAVTQDDLDAGGTIGNVATAGSDETPTETASTEEPVDQQPDITIAKASSIADGGTAVDEVGDTINYTITVGNDGNVSLTNVSVSDTFITDLAFAGGDADSDSELDTNETWTYTGSYVVTQDDLDAGGTIGNVATAGSDETPTETASTEEPVDQQPDITIAKASSIADGGTAVDEVGDTINYTITVGNDGNVSLTNVSVSDTFITDLAFAGGDADSDSELDTNETWTYTGSYVVTQDDLDAGGTIGNVATAGSDETPTETASTEEPVDQQPDITIAKASSIADGGTAVDEVGDTINYTITVGNDGNVSLTNVSVSDTFITDLAFAGGDADSDSELDTNETWTYTGSYVVTQDDLDAGGTIGNVATAGSDETPTETASTEEPVDQQPDITIAKASSIADGGTAVDEVGDTINYTITVGNDGNVSLTNVSVSDTFITDLAFAGGDADSDSELDTNETWTYTGSYVVTQDDLDAGGTIGNVATAGSDETPTETASTEEPVDQQPDITIAKASSIADGGTAVDEVGDTINYTITVGNDGNVSLTNVSVSDTFITDLAFAGGDADSDSELDTNETWTYTGSYVVTQDDLDAGGTIGNVATAGSDETPTETASTEEPVDQQPDITIAKASSIADGGTAVDEVGDTINYTITVGNDGNVSLTNVSVSDTFITDLAFAGGDADSDSELDTNETWTYTGSYVVTQDDLDAGGTIGNVATAGSDETPTETASTEEPVDQQPDITIAKAAALADGGTEADQVGDVINYTIEVGNDGNISLTGVTVSDPLITDLTFSGGDADSDSELDVNETWTYEGSYTVTAEDFLTDATAEPDDVQPGFIDNTATVDSNETDPESDSESVPIRSVAPAGQITPTGTTCADYISGMAENFEDYYDFQGGDIQYSDNNKAPGVVNSVNPGVFFYYTGLSGRLKADADGDGTADPFSVTIDQSNDYSDNDGDPNNDFSLFETVKNDVKLYEIIDTNGNGQIDHDLGETCQQVRKDVVIDLTNEANGEVTISYTPTNPDALYVVGVKYDTDETIKGTEFDPANSPEVHYDFVTSYNGTPVEVDNPDPAGDSGVDLSYKFAALNLEGAPTTGGEALTPAALAPVIDAAIDYWVAQGVDAAGLNTLLKTDVRIEDLGGSQLGETSGLTVKLDDDAAGYGWSDSLDAVDADEIDLLSVLTHEFGHVLGYDHDVMDETLGVGERDLPQADAVDELDDAALSQLGIEGDLLFG